MKNGIHPKTQDLTASCACGFELPTRSTLKELSTTLCSNCHPFFTGEQRHVDTAGRIEKFNKKYNKK